MAHRATRSCSAEANVLPEKDLEYFGDDGDRMHMMFNFQVNQHLFYALAVGRRPAARARRCERTRAAAGDAQWANFLRNHDELDLGRLTDEQRQSRSSPSSAPRRRCSSTIAASAAGSRRCSNGDRRRLELAYSLMFTLPGTPVIRYGDEIGMGDDLSLKERERVRTPMQWSTEPNAGFSTATKTGAAGDRATGRSATSRSTSPTRSRDPNSLLNWTERMIRARKECPEIGWGDWKVLDDRLTARARAPLRLAQQRVLFAPQPRRARRSTVTLRSRERRRRRRWPTCSPRTTRGADGRGPHRVELEGYGYRWYRVGGLDYILNRSPA